MKEWRSVKLVSGAEVMSNLEQVFAAPVGKILNIWEERERSGEVEWLLAEVGRYAFKVVRSLSLAGYS